MYMYMCKTYIYIYIYYNETNTRLIALIIQLKTHWLASAGDLGQGWVKIFSSLGFTSHVGSIN